MSLKASTPRRPPVICRPLTRILTTPRPTWPSIILIPPIIPSRPRPRPIIIRSPCTITISRSRGTPRRRRVVLPPCLGLPHRSHQRGLQRRTSYSRRRQARLLQCSLLYAVLLLLLVAEGAGGERELMSWGREHRRDGLFGTHARRWCG